MQPIVANAATVGIPNAFTYQGLLKNASGTVLTGSYDFKFNVYDDVSAGSALITEVDKTLTVTNGYFSTPIELSRTDGFAKNAFLDIQVRLSGVGSFESLAPRVTINPSAYSLFARAVENATTTQRLALAEADLFKGRTVYDTDLNNLFVYNGSSWVSQSESLQDAYTNSSDGSVTTAGTKGIAFNLAGSGDLIVQNGGSLIATFAHGGTIDLSGATTANTFASSGAVITGGSIDGSVIGGSHAAAGTFTTLGTSGLATLESLGVTNAATVGGSLGVTGATTLHDTNISNLLSLNGNLAGSSLLTFGALAGTDNRLELVDTTGHLGTGHVLTVGTAFGSDAKPFSVASQGNPIIDTTNDNGVTIGAATEPSIVNIGIGTQNTINIGGVSPVSLNGNTTIALGKWFTVGGDADLTSAPAGTITYTGGVFQVKKGSGIDTLCTTGVGGCGAGGGPTSWTNLIAPTNNNPIDMGTFSAGLTFGEANVATDNRFAILDTATSASTGYLMTIGTASGSHEKPFTVKIGSTPIIDTTYGGAVTIGNGTTLALNGDTTVNAAKTLTAAGGIVGTPIGATSASSAAFTTLSAGSTTSINTAGSVNTHTSSGAADTSIGTNPTGKLYLGHAGTDTYINDVLYTGGGSAWSSLTDPAGPLNLAMGVNSSTFSFADLAAPGNTDRFNFTDTATGASTGHLVTIDTLSGSGEKPFSVYAQGVNIIDTTAAGALSLNGDTTVAAGKLFTLAANPGALGSSPNGTIWYDSGINKFEVRENGLTKSVCVDGDVFGTCGGAGGGGSSTWNTLADPSANKTFSMAGNKTTFTYGASTGTSDLFNLVDSSGNTAASGSLMNLDTASDSTLKPLTVSAQGVKIIQTGNVLGYSGGEKDVLIGGFTASGGTITSKLSSIVAIIANNIALDGDATLTGALNVTGDTTIDTALTAGSAHFTVDGASGAVHTTSTLAVDSTSTFGDNITLGNGKAINTVGGVLNLNTINNQNITTGTGLFTAGGNLVVTGITGTANITTPATIANLFNTTATTLSLGGDATTLNVGTTNLGTARAISIGTGTGIDNIHIGDGTGADTISIGGGASGIETIAIGSTVAGSAVTVNSGNVSVGTNASSAVGIGNASSGTTAIFGGTSWGIDSVGNIRTTGRIDSAASTFHLFDDAASSGNAVIDIGPNTSGLRGTTTNISTDAAHNQLVNIGSNFGSSLVTLAGNTSVAGTLGVTGGITVPSGQSLNTTVGGNLSIGNLSGATSLNLVSGTGGETFQSQTTTNDAFTFRANDLTTGSGLFVSETQHNTGSANKFVINSNSATSGVVNGIDLQWNQWPGSGVVTTENLLRIQNQVSTNTYDQSVSAGILIDNADTNATGSTIMAAAIQVTNSGNIVHGITTGLDVSDSGILNAINIGGNAIAGTNFNVTAAGQVNGTSFNGKTVTFGAGSIYETTSNSITSLQLATSLTNETGSGSVVFATSPTLATATLTSPTLVTPIIGVATGTSLALTSGGTGLDTSAVGSLNIGDSTASIVDIGSSSSTQQINLGHNDANKNIFIGTGAGTNAISIGNNVGATNTIIIGGGTGTLSLNSNTTIATGKSLTLTNGNILVGDGNGLDVTGAAGIQTLYLGKNTEITNIGTDGGVAANVNIGGVAAIGLNGNVTIASGKSLSLSSGALTNVASLDTIATSATALTFAGAGTISSAATTNLTITSGSTGIVTLDSGTTGDVRVGTSPFSKAIAIGNNSSSGTISLNDNVLVTSTKTFSTATGFSVDTAGQIIANFQSAGTQALCHSGAATGSGTITDCSGTPTADYAEQYPTEPNSAFGDIMVPGSKEVITKNGDHIVQLVKSSIAYQGPVSGIVSDNTGDFTSAGYNVPAEENPMSIALVGRVPVNVVSEGGDIHVGDFITTSSTAGKGMKATKAGRVIGMAISNWDGTSPSVMVQVLNTWYQPATDLQGSSAALTTLSGDISVANATFTGNVTVEGHIIGSHDVAGRARMDSGKNKVHVTFEKTYEALPIVTISSRTDDASAQNAWLSDEDTTGFTINRTDTTSQVEFNWIAVGAQDAQVTISDSSSDGKAVSVTVENAPVVPVVIPPPAAPAEVAPVDPTPAPVVPAVVDPTPAPATPVVVDPTPVVATPVEPPPVVVAPVDPTPAPTDTTVTL